MTLNMTLVAPYAIYQCSDFQLSVWNTQKQKYDELPYVCQKQIFVNSFDWSATVTFTGLGSTRTIKVDKWLADQVISLPMDASYNDLIKRLFTATAWLRGVPEKDRRHTFIVTGFIGTAPIITLVSNFEDLDGAQLNTPKNDLFRSEKRPRNPRLVLTGWKQAVRKEDRLLLRNQIRRNILPQDFHDLLAKVNVRSAESDEAESTVSKACFTAHLLPDGTGESRPHGLSENEAYMPRFADPMVRFGLKLRPALDERGRPKPIRMMGMTTARSLPAASHSREDDAH